MTRDDRDSYEYVSTAMSTTVSVQIVGAHPNAEALAADALDWFNVVEAHCSRFDPDSELSRLCAAETEARPLSPLLFELLRLALAVAHASDGAFDPTLGELLRARGFDRHWRDAASVTPAHRHAAARVAWHAIVLDEAGPAVRLPPGTTLDLGAIAKGFAIDLAARALSAVADCAIVAGGDLLCRGVNARGRPWRTAIVDPLAPGRAAGVVEVDAPEFAVCTSGGYARHTAHGHHLLDARTAGAPSAGATAGSTVVAPQAAIADALATAAFVLGAERARPMLEAQGVDAVLFDASGAVHLIHGWGRMAFTATTH